MLLRLAVTFALLATVSFAAPAKKPPTPEQAWKASLVEDNADWATKKHAILKINDAAYVHAGEYVSLVGDAKNPDSWKWAKGKKAGAVVVGTFANGKPLVTKDGKPVSDQQLAKGVD